MTEPPRSLEQRVKDARVRLANEIDAWVATADPAGVPCLVPLSFSWDGSTLLLATRATNPTARNLAGSGQSVRLTIGTTRDVLLIDGVASEVALAELPVGEGDAFTAKTGFDPRTLRARYVYLRVTPVAMQAWREADEQAGRHIMEAGRWLA